MIPLRNHASDRSEMVSQLLFGEVAEVLEEFGSWQRVKLEYDGYSGWVDKKQMLNISEEEIEEINTSPSHTSTDLVQLLELASGEFVQVVMGSSLPLFKNKMIRLSGTSYKYEGIVSQPGIPTPERWMEFAIMYLNAPYLWGGRSPFGIDCSGFTQMVMKLCGIRINRDASQQSEQGIILNMLDESRPGDFAFFDNAEGKITHVGIILPDGQIIHASGKVRIDKLDHHGIYNTAQKNYTHKLRIIKRII